MEAVEVPDKKHLPKDSYPNPESDPNIISQPQDSTMSTPVVLRDIDPPPRPTWKGAKIVDKSLWFKAELGPLKIKLNPLVSVVSFLLILAFILWCILAKDRKLPYLIIYLYIIMFYKFKRRLVLLKFVNLS